MARAEPTLAWIVPPATLAAERSRPVIAGGAGGAPDRWGFGFSTLVHIGLVALIATLALAPRLDAPPPALEVLIVAATGEQPDAGARPAPANQGAPLIEPAPQPPVESASAPQPEPSPPPTPPVEAQPAPPPPEPVKAADDQPP